MKYRFLTWLAERGLSVLSPLSRFEYWLIQKHNAWYMASRPNIFDKKRRMK